MKNRNFQLLWFGQTISLFGSQISAIAIPLTAVTILQANPLQMGLLQTLYSLPFFLFSLFVGVWLDRSKRKPFLLYTNLLSFILLLAIPLLYFFNLLTIYHLYIIIFLTATASMILELAYLSYIPSIVAANQLPLANSKLEASRSVSSIAGPSLAGGLIAALSAPFAIFLDAISLLMSAALIHLVRNNEQIHPSSQQNIIQAIKEGLSAILKEPILRSITFSTAVLNFCGSAFGAVYILYLVNFLGMSALSLGFILGIGSVGALIGSFIANKLTSSFGIGKTLLLCCIFILAGSIIPPAIPKYFDPSVKFALLSLGQLLSSTGSTVYFITQVSLRQSTTPNYLLGRVNSSSRFLSRSFMPLGAFAGGLLGSLVSVKLTLFLFGIGFLFSAILLLTSPVSNLIQLPEEHTGT